MKIAKLAIGVVLIGCLTAGATWGQAPVEPAAYGYAVIQDETVDSPSDSPPVPPVAGELAPPPDVPIIDDSNLVTQSVGAGCSSCYGAQCGACGTCCNLGEPFRVFGTHQTTGIEVGGWISAGGLINEWGYPDNGPLGFNDNGEGFNVHQAWLHVGKQADTGGCGLDWGGQIDYVYGIDGPDTQAFRGTGWDLGWNSSRDYGSAIPQAYAEIAMNYLTIKAGYFYTLIGYEVVQAPKNFFYSHSYTQYYIEPFTHTGAVATYDGFENWTFHGGWTAGWDTAFENINDSSTFLGGATYSPNDDVSLSYMTSVGYFGETGNDLYMHSIVLDMALTNRLQWVIQSDLHHQQGVGPGNQRAAAGINQYVIYRLNECWGAGMRFEWLHDHEGTFVTPGEAAGNFYNITAGINWKPHANVVFRPEVRYDWFSGNHIPGGLPFNGGQDSAQLSAGFDAIFLF